MEQEWTTLITALTAVGTFCGLVHRLFLRPWLMVQKRREEVDEERWTLFRAEGASLRKELSLLRQSLEALQVRMDKQEERRHFYVH